MIKISIIREYSMTTTLSRIIKYGLQTFLRNGWVSLATIIVMILALLVFHFLVIFDVITGQVITALNDKIDIAVYFKSDAKEDDILKLEGVLADLSEVKQVEYISKSKALDIFKSRHKNDATISQALDELTDNPLLASLNIRAKDPEYYAAIAGFLEGDNLSSIVEKVTYNQNRGAIERLSSVVGTLQNFGLVLTAFLAITAVLVTFNTIRLAIYSNREEIGIMRLVGASNKFIHGPYIVNGVLYGLIAAVVSLLLATPLIIWASPYVGALIPELSLTAYFTGNMAGLFGYQLLFGIFLGTVSSILAIRRYLTI